MKVTVILYATLRQYAPDGKEHNCDLSLDPISTASAVFDSLGIPKDFEVVILINGRHATRDTPLKAGDAVTLYPTMTGG